MSNFYQGIPGFGNDQQQLSEQLPQDLSMGVTEETLNPWGNIAGNTNVSQVSGYKRGGKIHIKEKAKRQRHKMASKLRKYGKKGDTILAHINPLEAMILKKLGGSGTINEDTGLPQFKGGIGNLFRSPIKTINKIFTNPTTARRAVGDAVGTAGSIYGAVTGNPYIAAAAGAARTGIRQDKGRNSFKDYLIGAAKHAAYATAGNYAANNLGASAYVAPEMSWTTPFSVSGPAGMSGGMPMGAGSAGGVGASSGTNTAGSYLGKVGKSTFLSNFLGGGGGQQEMGAGVSAGDDYPSYEDWREGYYKNKYGNSSKDEESWFDKFTRKTKDSLSDPATLLKVADLGMQYVNKPKAVKEKSPEQIGDEAKRTEKASRLTPAELAELEKYDLNRAQASRRIERNKYLPEERIGAIPPRYVKSHTPDEYQKYGRWLSYYDNPNYQGDPVGFKHGGVIEIDIMSLPGGFLDGDTGGLDDAIEALLTDGTHTQPARLADGEYVIDAHTVSMLGDGNSKAGAKKLDKMREAIRFDKTGNKKIPKKAKPLTNYMK